MLNPFKVFKRNGINKAIKKKQRDEQKLRIINDSPRSQIRALAVQSSRLTETFEQDMIRGSINPAIRLGNQALMDQAQTMAVQSVYGKKAVQYSIDQVVGAEGILPMPIVMKNKELDEALNDEISYEFDKWARKASKFSTNGQMNFRQFQQQMEASRFIFGEAFAIIEEDDYGIRVEVISPQRCRMNYSEKTKEGNYIIDSIEYTPSGRPVAYYFEILDVMANDSITGNKFRVDADDCFHYFKPNVPGQRRGISEFAPVIKELNQLDEFTFSTIVQKRMASNSMGFITTDANGHDSIDIEMDDEADDVYQEPDIIQEFEAGTMHQLAAGQDIKQITATQGADDYVAFNSAMESKIAMGFGFFKQGFLGDTSSINYSSARFGDAQQRNMIKSTQSTLRESVLEPLYERWLEWMYMQGKLVKSDRMVEFIAVNTDWIYPKSESIDPMKDLDIEIKAVEAGMRTRRDAITRLGGDDVDATFAGIEAEQGLRVPKNEQQLAAVSAPAEIAAGVSEEGV